MTELQNLSLEEKLELLELLELRDRRHRENMLVAYAPYTKQKEFHNASSQFRERLFMAGHQLGRIERPGPFRELVGDWLDRISGSPRP